MGLRFRKSFKIAPGVKFNLGKKSAGISIGGKHGGMSINTNSGARARVSAPGTGLSYSTKIGGKSSMSTNESKKSNGSCLITCLKGLGILLFISILFVFGWIAGLIWLIFFRKKTNPEKQKKYTILISAVSVLSFLFFLYGMFFAPPTPTALTISCQEESELDIDTDYIITLDYEPEDANISSVSCKTDNILLADIERDSNDSTKFVLHTKARGTINITASYGSVESNTLTFDIVDMEQQELLEEQEKLTEKTEQQEAKSDTESTAEPENVTEESITEENTTIETVEESEPVPEEPSSATESVPTNASSETTSEEALTNEATLSEEPTTQPEASVTTEPTQPSTENTDTQVWIDNTGKKYHSKSDCSNMDAAYTVSKEKAEEMGRTACKKCYK